MQFVETWPAERIDALKALYAAGASASEIAAELSIPGVLTVSRNAVIGKCHRLKLVRPPREETPADELQAKINRRNELRNAAQRKRRRVVASNRVAKPRPQRPELRIVQELQPLNLTLADLTMRDGKPVECRFITNDDLANATYCGVIPVVDGTSWCAHCRMRLQPSKGWIGSAYVPKIACAA